MVSWGLPMLCVALVFCGCESRLLYPFPNQDMVYSPFRSDELLENSFPDIERKEFNEGSSLDERNYYVSNDELDWYEAKDACKSMGMNLICPNTLSKNQDLKNFIRNNMLIPKDQYSGYWIGSHRVSGESPWTWECDGQEIEMSDWLPGEPNGYQGEDCVELKNDRIYLGWNNFYCTGTRRYICEKPPLVPESDKNSMGGGNEALHEEVLKELTLYPKKNEEITTDSSAIASSPHSENERDDYLDSILARYMMREPILMDFIAATKTKLEDAPTESVMKQEITTDSSAIESLPRLESGGDDYFDPTLNRFLMQEPIRMDFIATNKMELEPASTESVMKQDSHQDESTSRKTITPQFPWSFENLNENKDDTFPPNFRFDEHPYLQDMSYMDDFLNEQDIYYDK